MVNEWSRHRRDRLKAGKMHALPVPSSAGDLAWLADRYFGFFAYPGGVGGSEVKAGGIAAAMFAVGLVTIWRQRWSLPAATEVDRTGCV